VRSSRAAWQDVSGARDHLPNSKGGTDAGLANTPITDVEFSVGFNDLSYLAQMFRRYLGVRPSDSDYVQGTKNNVAQVHIPRALLAKPGATQHYRSAFAKQS
jgi:AraC-like DNA-binding protein